MDKAVKDDGGKVLWMPPYFPYLRPIEMYWFFRKGGGVFPVTTNSAAGVKSTVFPT